MKKLSILFCAGLFAAAITGGCKKDEAKGGEAAAGGGGGDCAALGAKMKKDGMAEAKDAPAEQKKMMEEMVGKMSDVLVKACKDDKWSKEAIACGIKAKDPEKECDSLITKEQKASMEKAFAAAMGMGGDEGGGGDEAGGGEAGGGAAAGGSSGMPECDEYVSAMEKYLACDKIPQASRDAAKQGIDAMKSGWANVGSMPDDVKKQMADGCKAAVDGLKQGATALGCTL